MSILYPIQQPASTIVGTQASQPISSPQMMISANPTVSSQLTSLPASVQTQIVLNGTSNYSSNMVKTYQKSVMGMYSLTFYNSGIDNKILYYKLSSPLPFKVDNLPIDNDDNSQFIAGAYINESMTISYWLTLLDIKAYLVSLSNDMNVYGQINSISCLSVDPTTIQTSCELMQNTTITPVKPTEHVIEQKEVVVTTTVSDDPDLPWKYWHFIPYGLILFIILFTMFLYILYIKQQIHF
jgi:hypothetical protein